LKVSENINNQRCTQIQQNYLKKNPCDLKICNVFTGYGRNVIVCTTQCKRLKRLLRWTVGNVAHIYHCWYRL